MADTVHYALDDGQELDAAVSAALGQAPALMPFSSDQRARAPMLRWLTEHGVAGDLSRMDNRSLCDNVLIRWFQLRTLAGSCGPLQQFTAAGTFRALVGGLSATSREAMDVAVARLLLLVSEPGYALAVRNLMAQEADDDDS